MMTDYICGICGSTYLELDDYLKCVSTCGKKLKAQKEAEAQKKYLEEVNAALNGVKQAKSYYEDQLKNFKEKYPKEYKLNFGHLDTEDCGSDCKDCKNDCRDNKTESKQSTSKSFLYRDNGVDKPIVKAKENGKDVALESLFNDEDCKYIAKLLGLL